MLLKFFSLLTQIESRLKFVSVSLIYLVVRSCFCYYCFIYKTFSEALAVKWARVALKILLNLLSLGKCLSINVRTIFATLVATFTMKRRGIEPVHFPLSRCALFIVLLVHVTSNYRFVLCPFSFNIRPNATQTISKNNNR